MFCDRVEHGHLCVMRLKEGINLSKKCNGDMISILQGTSKEGTSDVPIRVLEIPLDDGTKYILQQTCLILLLQKICSRNFTSTDGL